jgi:ubiquinone/menaquinone biosynthesis C-methylase UbiE
MKSAKENIISKSNYEGAWDSYAEVWKQTQPGLVHIGDEWIGEGAGAAHSLEQYQTMIEQSFILPYIKPTDTVLEIGVGGGKTASLLLKHCGHLICADVSSKMLNETKTRLGSSSVSYVKLDGLSLNEISDHCVDFCFSYDTMVHMEPRDIFNYLSQIPRLMRGGKLCIFHHTNTLSDLGWQKFLSEWDQNLCCKRIGTAFSVMTVPLMEKFLNHFGYEVILKDERTVPRDCVWVCRSPSL